MFVYRSGKVNLYQVESDRYEQNDLAKSRPEKVKQMQQRLIAWETEMGVDPYSGVK